MHTTTNRCLALALALGGSAVPVTIAACAAPDAAISSGSEADREPASPADLADGGFHGDACTRIAPAPHYNDWPRIRSEIRSDAADEAWIQRVVKAMSLEQKVGQMTQAEIGSLWDPATASYQLADLTRLGVGSVLNGGGSWPEANKHAAVADWIHLADAIWDASPALTVPGRHGATQVKVPAFWGIDAVHGDRKSVV